MKTYAFIFARGGSKGLPKKNILNLAGKPLIGHSIDLAFSLEEIDKVFVSTENKEIAEIAEEYNAEVIMRPNSLATDTSPEIDSWKHAINHLFDEEDKFDRFISLPATAPLRNKDDIRNALDSLEDSIDLVVTVTEAQRSPYFNMVKINDDGFVSFLSEPDELYFRRQDVPICYDLTTVAYVASPQYILSTNRILDGKVKAVNVPRERAVDIDTKIDFMLADLLINQKEDLC